MPKKKPASLQASMAQRTKIDPEAKLRFQKKDPPGTTYRCTCCGEFYPTQASYFYKSASPLYEGNNGFISVCKNCVRSYFDYLSKYFGGDDRKAMERICQLFDIYYCENAFVRADESQHEHLPLVSSYISKIGLKAFTEVGTNYLDTIRDRANAPITEAPKKPSFVEDEDDDDEEDSVKIEEWIRKWGPGYQPSEYELLDSHYDELKAMLSDDDPMKEIYIRDMCTTKVFQNRALMSSDADLYDKMTRSYQTTAKLANFKPKADIDTDSKEAAFGVFISNVEKYAPAEYYQDKTLFKDSDSIEDYFRRMIVRPFKNFITGSREMDPEYSVDTSDGGDATDA